MGSFPQRETPFDYPFPWKLAPLKNLVLLGTLALPRKLAPLKKLAPIGTLSSLETLASLLPWILNSKQRYILKAKKFAEPELQSQNHQNPEKCKKCVLFPSVPVVVQRQAGRRDGAQTANWELVTSQDKIWDRLPLEYRLVRTTVH